MSRRRFGGVWHVPLAAPLAVLVPPSLLIPALFDGDPCRRRTVRLAGKLAVRASDLELQMPAVRTWIGPRPPFGHGIAIDGAVPWCTRVAITNPSVEHRQHTRARIPINLDVDPSWYRHVAPHDLPAIQIELDDSILMLECHVIRPVCAGRRAAGRHPPPGSVDPREPQLRDTDAREPVACAIRHDTVDIRCRGKLHALVLVARRSARVRRTGATNREQPEPLHLTGG